ncbi:sulfurtransferase TusA family protein [uncultured Desulfuromusa sp.]|uniref:sulfurtransferase TusA family protein n=1 Tax=uncultured Desulfuromusa sp. TaxID=219183 RepID=UPI002AA62817|nr:sulfurtransferase TusA family protein [uncultured Desulfuromusa sp.]
MMEHIDGTVEIDVCGQICPSSLLTALREVNRHKEQLRSGHLQLNILTDNHDSTNRICDAVSNMGYQIEVEDKKKYYKISIAKMTAKMRL